MIISNSIIVYGNPMEQAFWESGLALPISATMVITILASILVGKISDWALSRFTCLPWYKRQRYTANIVLCAAVIIGVACIFAIFWGF